MNKINWAQSVLRYAGIGIVIALILSLILDSSNGWGGSEVFTSIALLFVIGAIVYLKTMQNVTEKDVTRRIRSEYAQDIQPQVFEAYRHLKAKELEGLFLKILDDSNGDLGALKKLTSVAESVGWKAFIENHW